MGHEIKVKWLAAGVFLIPSSVEVGLLISYDSVELYICLANGNQKPAALTNKKEIIMTK
jgi:hypothetical protein